SLWLGMYSHPPVGRPCIFSLDSSISPSFSRFFHVYLWNFHIYLLVLTLRTSFNKPSYDVGFWLIPDREWVVCRARPLRAVFTTLGVLRFFLVMTVHTS